MLRYRSTTPLLFAALITVGCAGKTLPVGFTTPTTMSPITQAELEASGVSDPYEAVRLLRPNWLRRRVRTGKRGGRDGLPTLYVQNMRVGSVNGLRDFRMEGIKEMRYISGLNATTRWGVGNTSGVIEVIWLTQSER